MINAPRFYRERKTTEKPSENEDGEEKEGFLKKCNRLLERLRRWKNYG